MRGRPARDVARAAGVSEGWISRLVNGRERNPRLQQLAKLARARYGCSGDVPVNGRKAGDENDLQCADTPGQLFTRTFRKCGHNGPYQRRFSSLRCLTAGFICHMMGLINLVLFRPRASYISSFRGHLVVELRCRGFRSIGVLQFSSQSTAMNWRIDSLAADMAFVQADFIVSLKVLTSAAMEGSMVCHLWSAAKGLDSPFGYLLTSSEWFRIVVSLRRPGL